MSQFKQDGILGAASFLIRNSNCKYCGARMVYDDYYYYDNRNKVMCSKCGEKNIIN